MKIPYILVLYDTNQDATKNLAYLIAQGVHDAGLRAMIRRVPKVSAVSEQSHPAIPDEGDLYCTADDLRACSGLAMGSPTHFGNMSASLKYFWDNTVAIWLAGDLQGKPACVFTTSGSMHGGQESTLLTMMMPLLHHGMLLMGLPYAHPELSVTVRGGTPYGASHVSGVKHQHVMTVDEQALAIAQGVRLATLVKQLQAGSL